MTFNDGARIEAGRVRRGGGGRGGKVAIGGGVGGIIVVILVLLFGGDPGSLLGSGTVDQNNPSETGSSGDCLTGAAASIWCGNSN